MAVVINGNNGISYDDTGIQYYGTDDDLAIRFDGTDAIINETGSGDLKLQSGGTTKLTIGSGVSLNADLSTNGNDINFGDNDKAQFGTSNDLQIYHDGSYSRIADTGTGDLLISGSTAIRLRGASGSEMIWANDGSNVKLYYNNSQKLATTSTGIDVTGTVTADQYDNDEALPTIKPSLLLDFANSKTLDPRITFTRASTATYYDGKTTVKAEENLLKYSQEFDQWSTARGSITANATTAPDGTTTADKLYHTTGTGEMVAYTNISSYISGVNYIVSCFFKAAELDFAVIRTASGATKTWFNLSTVAVGTNNHDSAGIIDVGNGWYRCYVTTTLASTQIDFGGAETNGGAEPSTVNDGVYIWGAQLEQRSDVTAYTPTTSLPITKYIPKLMTAPAGVARFDHDPDTKESKGLLIEEQRVNYVYNSSDLGYANHTSSSYAGLLYKNRAVGLDGNVSAAFFSTDPEDDSRTTLRISVPSGVLPSSSTITSSVYLKEYGSHSYRVQLETASYSTWSAPGINVFNLKTGEVESTATDHNTGIEEIGNGWYRCWFTADTSSSTGTNGFYITIADSTGAHITSSTNEGYNKGLYIWGVQQEKGAFPTSYIPTSGSTVTRAGEFGQIDNIDFANQTNGTLYTEYMVTNPEFTQSYTRGVFSLFNINSASTYHNSITLTGCPGSTTYSGGAIYTNSSQQVNLQSGTITGGVYYKQAMAYAENDAAYMHTNKSSISTDTTVVLPDALNTMRIGTDYFSNRYLDGYIKKIAYYPARLSNATLTALTES